MTNLVKPNIGRDTELICNNEQFSWAYLREGIPHASGRHFVNFRSCSSFRCAGLTFYDFFSFHEFSTCEIFKGVKNPENRHYKSRPPIIHKSHVFNYHSILFLLSKIGYFLSGFILKIGRHAEVTDKAVIPLRKIRLH